MATDIDVLYRETKIGSPDTRESLLATLRGAKVILPDLQAMMKHYPAGVNPHSASVHEDVQQSLDDLFSTRQNDKRRCKMKAANHALLGAFWWPDASYETLRIATFFLTWLFYWDDEVDSQEFSNMIEDIAGSTKYRQETLAYIEACLFGSGDADISHISTNPLITGFETIGKTIAKTYSQRQLREFFHGLRLYIETTMEEQVAQIEDCLPTPSEYLARRLYTGGVYPTFAIHEYAIGVELPEEVMESDMMRIIKQEANLNICVVNDILSIKKEVEQGQIDSLVPLLLPGTGTVQDAINQASDILKASIRKLDAAEKTILERYSADAKVYNDLQRFINSCKHACTANLNWSLMSTRYKLGRVSMEGGVPVEF